EAQCRKRLATKLHRAKRRGKDAAFDAHRNRFDVGHAARAKPLRQMRVRADHRVEHVAETAKMAPEAAKPPVDRVSSGDTAEPPIRVGREWIGVHDQRSRRRTL